MHSQNGISMGNVKFKGKYFAVSLGFFTCSALPRPSHFFNHKLRKN